jgi:hypothetical protein
LEDQHQADKATGPHDTKSCRVPTLFMTRDVSLWYLL